MTAPHLRAARSTDAGSVGAILSDFIDETPWMPRIHTRAEDLSFAGTMIDRGWVTVAETDNEIVGFSSNDNDMVHALYVRDTARLRGIGRALIDHLRTTRNVLVLWTFQANRPARLFYERLGFYELERTDGMRNDEGLPDIKFGWEACNE